MVSTLWGAFLGGLAGSIIGAIAHWYATRYREEEETKRRKAEAYIGHKAGAMAELQSSLDAAFRSLKKFHQMNVNSVSREDYLHELLPTIEEFKRSLSRAGIYLDESEMEQMEDTLLEFKLAAKAIEDKALAEGPGEVDRQFELKEIRDGLEELREVLRDHMKTPIDELAL